MCIRDRDIAQLSSCQGATVYVNLTNRCPCACTFCLRQTKEMEEGHSLWLKKEPTVEEVIQEFQKYDLDDFKEVDVYKRQIRYCASH